MKNTKKVGTEFGTLDATMTNKNQTLNNIIDLTDSHSAGGDITIDLDFDDDSDSDSFTWNESYILEDLDIPVTFAAFPADPLAIVCELKNKNLSNPSIVHALETFAEDKSNKSVINTDPELNRCFTNPSKAAKDKASDIRNHFESKFTIAALKSGTVSKTRKKMLRILRIDFSPTKPESISFPLLTSIPDLYDEDVKLKTLQDGYRNEKADYEDVSYTTKTLYPVVCTSRGKNGGADSSHSGASYFWVDDDRYIYRIWSERSNKLRPFIDYFFSKQSIDFVIHKQKIDKVPSLDLFFYDVKNFSIAEIVDI